jgi:hypothetical protein
MDLFTTFTDLLTVMVTLSPRDYMLDFVGLLVAGVVLGIINSTHRGNL